ncbi:MAG: Na/Pi cotransporter family protein [Deltaproteobacteria bacterium]|nr:Na/Pi cotransporter family protein [Deltaproteobacteria bacterium]MBT4638256.1 Na/Pi cotransporter family protein [Deltaproteobacteria bacterium]MBT7153051.1 Na/Pi cotransporter family protein [Deltaproteobacteria bacterium]MBT7711479.1 Na/Pi cotransporter family protein [Deltaproteobacteria bacterium]
MVHLLKKYPKVALPFILIFILSSQTTLAASGSGQISWMMLIFGLVGGLALFLFGMELMSEGMKKTAGNQMRAILATLTSNRVVALLLGAFVTMVIQSSSATTVMLVSFVQAGLLTFVQAMGVILGADIGTTITAQMIAFKLTDYALLMIAIGFAVRMFGKGESARNIGEAILGFGILFFGMKMMSDAMKPLRTYSVFIEFLRGLENPVLGILVGALFTALVQSSSAFTGVVIVLAQQNLITLEAGIPMVFGANVGTCVTAGLASIGTSREAKRVALAHVMFKLAGVCLFVFWIPTFAGLIHSIAKSFDSGTARQIANAHTIFNVSLALIFLPFTQLFARLIMKILPEEPVDQDIQLDTWALDDTSITTPGIALDLARTELSRMAKILSRMLDAIILPFMSNEPQQDKHFPQLSLMEGVDLREEKIDFLDEKIRDYLIQVSQQNVSDKQAVEIFGMISIASDMENIGDLIHRNLKPLIPKKKDLSMDFSEDGKEELMIYHSKVMKQISLLEQAFQEVDLKKAREIMGSERSYLDLELQYRTKHLSRLLKEDERTKETHEVHMELMDILKQIVVYSSNIANNFATIKA